LRVLRQLLVACIVALPITLLLLQCPSLAAPPDVEPLATTREGYKARNERHRYHEHLFSSYATGRKLLPNLSTAYSFNLEIPKEGEEVRIQSTFCTADTVAIVTPYNARPVLSKDESFIFTEYKVEANEILKGNLRVGDRITIARIGGVIDNIPNDHIQFLVPQEWPLVIGHKYIVFLTYLSPTNDYTSYNLGETYEIQPGGRTILQLIHGHKPQPDNITSVLRASSCATGGLR